MTRHGNPSRSRATRAGRPALLRFVVALAVMLVAVLPHATLAASAFHAAPASAATAPAENATSAGHAAHGAEAAAPCHDAGHASDAGPSKPSCCVLGCGLLGTGPAEVVVTVPATWHRLIAEPAVLLAETEPGPAERPPRRTALSD
jgi:hypothetical protein